LQTNKISIKYLSLSQGYQKQVDMGIGRQDARTGTPHQCPVNSLAHVTKKKILRDKPLFFSRDNSTYLYMGDTLLIHVTVNEDNPFSNTTPPPTNTRKRTLEASAAEFIEKGWKLLFEIHPIEEYTAATVFSQPVGEAKGI
jgi:hypothetical protein